MEILLVLLSSFVLLRVVGYLGVGRLGSWRHAGLGALAIMFLVTSTAHFNAMKHDLAAMMPEPLPDGLWIIYLTGVFEIAGAVGLLVPRTRRLAGIGLVLLLIAMFPANVNAALNGIPLGGEAPTPLWLRTPMQLLFIAMVWWTSIKASPGGGTTATRWPSMISGRRKEEMTLMAQMTVASDCGHRARRRGDSRGPTPTFLRWGSGPLDKRALPGGQVILVRTASPEDRNRLRRMFSRLSPTSIYRRFHSPLPRVPEWAVTRAVEVDHHDEESLIAVVEGEIVGQAMYVRLASGDEAEAAVVVEDGWQRRGVGKLLMSRLAERARHRGIAALTGAVLPENVAMRGLITAHGGLRYSTEDGAFLARVPLHSSSPERLRPSACRWCAART